MSVLGEFEGMVGFFDGRLQVAQQRVDRTKFGPCHAGLAAPGDHRFMLGAHDRRGAKARQPVGDHTGRRGQVFGGEHRHLLARMRLLAQAGQKRVPVWRGLHRRHEGDLVLRAAPGLAARTLAAQERIVHLHPAVEFTPALKHQHGLHDLVLHQSGRAVAHPELAHAGQTKPAGQRAAASACRH